MTTPTTYRCLVTIRGIVLEIKYTGANYISVLLVPRVGFPPEKVLVIIQRQAIQWLSRLIGNEVLVLGEEVINWRLDGKPKRIIAKQIVY